MAVGLRELAVLVALAAALAACAPVKRVGGAINPFDDKKKEEAKSDGERISFLTFEQRLKADPALAGAEIALPSAYPNALWPMEGGYPSHMVEHPALAEDIRRVWSRDTGEGSGRKSRVSAPPVTADGLVFVMDGEGDVAAFDAKDGDRKWRTNFKSGSKRDREARAGGVAVSGGRVFVTSGFGFVAALDAKSGETIWRSKTKGPMHAAPTILDGRVFAVSFDNELYALAAETGEVLWTYESLSEPARILSVSSPAASGEVVVAPFASGEIVALRVQNGRPIWSESLTRTGVTTALSSLNDIAGSPVIAGDVVYAVSHSGVLAALDLRTGQRLWSQPAGGIHMPWVAGDFIFVVTNEAELACLSRKDGRVFWINELKRYDKPKKRRGRVSWAGPVLAGGRLLMVSSEGKLHYFSPQTGEELGGVRIGETGFIPPIVAGETVYVLNDEARLSALR